MASVTKGTTCLYGIGGTVSNMYVQSYSISSSFNADATVVDEGGLTVTHRVDDRMSEITVEGIVKTSDAPNLGDKLTFTVKTDSAYGASGSTTFNGLITKVDEKGGSSEFVKVTVTAKSYESISY